MREKKELQNAGMKERNENKGKEEVRQKGRKNKRKKRTNKHTGVSSVNL